MVRLGLGLVRLGLGLGLDGVHCVTKLGELLADYAEGDVGWRVHCGVKRKMMLIVRVVVVWTNESEAMLNQ